LYGVALPQGFDGNKGDFAYCSSISIVVLLYSVFGFLTIGIRALSLGIHCGEIFFIFADFFSEKKKEGRDIPDIFSIFLCIICRKGLYI
jgi:hypothetical protein